jgi:hypothetical protein
MTTMKKLLELALKYKKAIAGFVTPGVVTLLAAMQDGSEGGSAVTRAEWVGVALACFGTSALVAGLRNIDPKEPAA